MYYGWSHDEGRMQMMDLPSYLDSFRMGYERALEDLQGQLANLTSMMPAGSPASPWQLYQAPGAQPGSREHGHGHHHHGDDCGCGCGDHEHDRGREHHHDHDHHHGHDHDRGCGCRGHGDCQCTCCIVDADYVVYARCFERRVIPIEVENDTRRARENVTVEVSDVRTAGGRSLPWNVAAVPTSPITIEACGHTEIDLVVNINCRDNDKDDEPKQPRKATARTEDQGDVLLQREGEPIDVDACEVGYVTVRLDGCLVRPIVVAIAVLPRDCDAYHTGCSCSCCC
jgi:hypothetical protein